MMMMEFEIENGGGEGKIMNAQKYIDDKILIINLK